MKAAKATLRNWSFDRKDDFQLDTERFGEIEIETDAGKITVELYSREDGYICIRSSNRIDVQPESGNTIRIRRAK